MQGVLLYDEWKETGFEILQLLAAVCYWPAVQSGMLPVLIRDWKALESITDVHVFRVKLSELRADIKKYEEE